MKEIHILFTGAGRRIELINAFREAALVLNKNLKIYGSDMAMTAPSLAYCDFARQTVSMHSSGYISNLLDICKNDKIDLIIPTIDTDLLVLSENKARFDAVGTKVMVSSPDMIRVCRDKNNTFKFFDKCGLKSPMPADDWNKYKLGYPAFIKPKDGSSSINTFKVNSEKELELYAAQIKNYIVQPFIEGHEYTIDVFCDFNGRPISIVPRERIQVRAGEVLKTRIEMDEIMIGEAKKICKAFEPCGPITVQLIHEKNLGTNFYIEINPRFGGGAPLSMKAGARSAETILKLLDGESAEYCDNIADGAVYSRFDMSVCINEGKCSIKGVIFDLDDTLYSEKEYMKSGYNAVAEYLGDTVYSDRLWSFFESGKPAIDELLGELGRESEKDAVLEIYRSHKPNLHLYDGVKEMLIKLRSHGIKIGIITDGRPEGQHNKISSLGLEELVDDIIITDELGGVQFRKPCDIAFRIMQNRWRLSASQIVYVGDNPAKDFQAPRQLGMKSVYFENTDGLYFSKNVTVNITEVTNIFELEKWIN